MLAEETLRKEPCSVLNQPRLGIEPPGHCLLFWENVLLLDKSHIIKHGCLSVVNWRMTPTDQRQNLKRKGVKKLGSELAFLDCPLKEGYDIGAVTYTSYCLIVAKVAEDTRPYRSAEVTSQ